MLAGANCPVSSEAASSKASINVAVVSLPYPRDLPYLLVNECRKIGLQLCLIAQLANHFDCAQNE
jgi:hypothetical protein